MKRITLILLLVGALAGGSYALSLAADTLAPPANPPTRVIITPDPTPTPAAQPRPEDPEGRKKLGQRIARLRTLRAFAAELDKQGKQDEAKVIRKLLRRPYRISDGKLINLLDYLEAELAPCLPPQHQTDDGGIAWPAPGDWQQFFEMLMEYLPQLIELLLAIFALFALFAQLGFVGFLALLALF